MWGRPRTSSVILYAMMHIFSHFCFWTFSILLYLWLYGREMSAGMAVFMTVCSAFCAAGIYFFQKGYKNGLAMKALRLLAHIRVEVPSAAVHRHAGRVHTEGGQPDSRFACTA